MKSMKVLIIDDEPLGRKIIREYLDSHPEVHLSGECENAHQALKAIERNDPDLLFLDIQMPEINGIELLGLLDEMPHVIFSTAYDEYAIRAFELNAIDYLLKPYDQDRFDLALSRAKERIEREDRQEEKIAGLMEQWNAVSARPERLLVKDAGRIVVVKTREIDWIEAMEDYITLHTSGGDHLMHQSMNYMEEILEETRFIRIHRSFIVNLEAVLEIVPWSSGRWKCKLKDGKELMISRSGARKLKQLMI